MHDPHEQQQRVTPRGRSATHAQHQRLPLASTREEMGADTLKVNAVARAVADFGVFSFSF